MKPDYDRKIPDMLGVIHIEPTPFLHVIGQLIALAIKNIGGRLINRLGLGFLSLSRDEQEKASGD